MCDDTRVYRDDVIVREFSLSVDGIRYKSAEKTLWFEAALGDICRQIKSDYYIKCCFTCQYSDYSPYGSDDYGLMLCFCRHKDDCLKVNSKDDFFSFLEGKDYDGRQETYLCGHYCLRDKASGYRGLALLYRTRNINFLSIQLSLTGRSRNLPLESSVTVFGGFIS